jgi:hypothetical protein
MALPAQSGPWSHIQFRNHCSQTGTPWMSDQLVARTLPKHRTTQTQNKSAHTNTPNIQSLIGIRTHDPSVRASEESSCLRLRGYCDWLMSCVYCVIITDYRKSEIRFWVPLNGIKFVRNFIQIRQAVPELKRADRETVTWTDIRDPHMSSFVRILRVIPSFSQRCLGVVLSSGI